MAFAGAAVSGPAPDTDTQAVHCDAVAPAPAALPPLLVSAGADRSLRLWNAHTMQRERALYKRPAEVSALAVSR